MNFNEYQQLARSTAVYPSHLGLYYTTLGLSGEAGEIANKVKKVIRNNNGVCTDEYKTVIMDELSDTLWYVANLAYELGYSLDEVAEYNIHKLRERAEKGEIKERNNNIESF